MLAVLCACVLALAVLLVWRRGDAFVKPPVPIHRATLTEYESYPSTEEECIKFSGCHWQGQFAVGGKKSREWVKRHNIAAVHVRHAAFKNKWLRIFYKGRKLDVKVIDVCADGDIKDPDTGEVIPLCTMNMNYKGTGFLIDLEVHTARRLGFTNGKDVAQFRLIRASQVEYLGGSEMY